MVKELLQAKAQHEAVGDGEGADRQQRVRGAANHLGAVDALAPQGLHDDHEGHGGAAGAPGPALDEQWLAPALRHEAQDALQVRRFRPVAVRALRREDILKHHGMRFPGVGEHRLRVVGLAYADDLPAPRISREKRLDFGMVADGKLPLEAVNEHEVR